MKTTMKKLLILSALRCGTAIALVFGAVMLLSPGCGAQSPGPAGNNPTLGKRIPQPRDVDPSQIDTVGGVPAYYEKRMQMLNAAQHRSMVADTERLVKLVADLNAQINSSKANSLTPDQLHMVAEIEKLAHNVKDKMRMAVRSAANIDVGPPAAPFGPR
jgi:hypothetical protein